ncbi:MAG: endonuclease/exonuclease/phosphatase family protein [Bacteroidales bacterium]|nr:endonuclease/exonuclease/phosphatase family protein [Bacteroidales bacterium]
MKAKFLFVMALLLAFGTSCIAGKPNSHKVMTCNVRVANIPEDDVDGKRWDDRKDYCLKTILKRNPDIICMQEVIYDSEEFFEEKLKNYYSFGFDGPEMDPYSEGYHLISKNSIFVKKSRYDILGGGQYWLSEDPLTGGSYSFGSYRARHCTWLRLRDKKTGVEFRILDAHLDHRVDSARACQTNILIRESAQYQEDFPQILCGDFNSGIQNAPFKMLKEAGWKEALEEINGPEEFGRTFHGFEGDARKKGKNRRIDFIFSRGGIKPIGCEVIKDNKDGMYPSDHYFIQAEYILAE